MILHLEEGTLSKRNKLKKNKLFTFELDFGGNVKALRQSFMSAKCSQRNK